MLLGTILAVADDPPTFSPDHEYFWVVHDSEEPAAKEQRWGYSDNLLFGQTYKKVGPWEEIWYTDSEDPSSLYPGEIRPIRDEGWHQNTWVRTIVTTDSEDACLNCTIYSPNNNYPEYIEWTIGNGDVEGAYFQITVYDYDTQEILVKFTHSVVDDAEACREKLDAWIDQFVLELEYFKY